MLVLYIHKYMHNHSMANNCCINHCNLYDLYMFSMKNIRAVTNQSHQTLCHSPNYQPLINDITNLFFIFCFFFVFVFVFVFYFWFYHTNLNPKIANLKSQNKDVFKKHQTNLKMSDDKNIK